MPSEYKISVTFTRDLNTDTGLAFSHWPDLELNEALKKLMEKDLKEFTDDFGGNFNVSSVNIPNGVEEKESQSNLIAQVNTARIVLETGSGTQDDRKKAVELLMSASSKLGTLTDRITKKIGDTVISMTSSDYEQICDHISNDKMIDAIKIIRTASGLGLKECKDYAEGLKIELNNE